MDLQYLLGSKAKSLGPGSRVGTISVWLGLSSFMSLRLGGGSELEHPFGSHVVKCPVDEKMLLTA